MNIISCTMLEKRFGSTKALFDIDLSLDAGAPIALIGPNGAGKTTLFSIICGFLKPSSGHVNVLGCKPGSADLHGRLSALPQDTQFDPRFTVGHQLVLFSRLQGDSTKFAKIEAQRVLEQVDLSETFDMKPEALSHGMRKRVLFAQTLLGKPDLILLDEPTAGLDPPNVKVMRTLISEAAADATFVISSHNLDELEKVCKSVVYLEKGELKSVSDIDQASSSGYLTLVLADQAVTTSTLESALATVTGVISIAFSPPNRYVIAYDTSLVSNIELLVLEEVIKQGWQYRQLVNGRTLEDQLYT